MIEGSNASALLWLHGMVMTAVEVADEVTITVETTADRVGCRSRGVIASLHDRRRVRVRDLEIASRSTVLIWNKRIWRCREAQCSTCTWTERHDAIAPRASLTERAGAEMCRRVGEDGDPVAAVGRDFGVGWACVMNAVEVHGRRLVDDPDRIGEVSQLGLDETAFQRPSALRGHTSYVTGFVDLTRPRLLDVVEDRTGAAVDSWLSAQPAGWLANIAEVALDPHRRYSKGLTSTLPHATVVVDRFHAIGLANRAVDDVRRRVQNETLGHRGRTGDPHYGIRRLLLRGYERLSVRQLERITAGLVGDRYGEVGAPRAGHQIRAVPRDVHRHRPRARPPAPDRVLRLRRSRRSLRAHPLDQDHLHLGNRNPCVPHHRRPLQRTHRGHQLADQEDQTGSTRWTVVIGSRASTVEVQWPRKSCGFLQTVKYPGFDAVRVHGFPALRAGSC